MKKKYGSLTAPAFFFTKRSVERMANVDIIKSEWSYLKLLYSSLDFVQYFIAVFHNFNKSGQFSFL